MFSGWAWPNQSRSDEEGMQKIKATPLKEEQSHKRKTHGWNRTTQAKMKEFNTGMHVLQYATHGERIPYNWKGAQSWSRSLTRWSMLIQTHLMNIWIHRLCQKQLPFLILGFEEKQCPCLDFGKLFSSCLRNVTNYRVSHLLCNLSC